MTTHIVEIRRRATGAEFVTSASNAQWTALTRDPITKRDADNLVTMIGTHWEARVVALESPMGHEFAELERYFREHRAKSAEPIKRWEKIDLAHHPDCGLKGGRPAQRWETREFGTEDGDLMTASEWVNFRDIREAAARFTIDHVQCALVPTTPTVHQGGCPTCGARKRALSVVVTITNVVDDNKVKTSREYAL